MMPQTGATEEGAVPAAFSAPAAARAGRALPRTRRAIPLVALLLLAAAPARADDPFLRRTPTVEAVEKVGPAVVNIVSEQVVSAPSPFGGFAPDPLFERFFRDFFPQRPQRAQSIGSGVIIDPEGHVLTNEHVVRGAERVRVTLGTGAEYDAEVIGADPNTDIAVLAIETDDPLPWVPPARSDDLMVGEPVIAIGNPFGLSHTVTTGVISALDRSIRTGDTVYHGFLQTDAAINPGNSGGPLLNARGELIGINTAIYSGAQGIGFAIPIDAAMRVVRELIEHGEVAPVWLGLSLQDLDPEIRAALGLARGARGAIVTRVYEKSPAERAGVRRGDLLTHVDGLAVDRARSFHEILRGVTVGQEVRLRLVRRGEKLELTAVADPLPRGLVAELAYDLLGVRLEPLDRGGYRITAVRPGSGPAQIGIRPGDLLLRVNGRALVDEEALERSILDLRGRSRALLTVQRGAGRYRVSVLLV